MRLRPFFRRRLLPALLTAGLAASLALPPAFANSYKRGGFSCSDFQIAEKDYQTKSYAVDYALCLIARNQGDDVKALGILDSEIAKGHVSAARLKALYIAGGTMGNSLDDRNYNEALQSYGKVLHLINLQPDYPKGFEVTEEVEQHELEAYYLLVHISYVKSLHGMLGIHNAHLLQSASYKGDRNLKLYPKYSPYTVDTLEKTIEHAGICADVPRKRHFKPLLYKQTMLYCSVMEAYVKELVALERERLTILNGKACTRDIERCSEYQDIVENKIFPLKKSREQKTSRIWQTKSVAELDNLEQ